MSIDGGLRKLFRKYLPTAQWTSVETGMTNMGVPDSEFCFAKGCQGWVEYKLTKGNTVRLRPEQVAWLDRRHRLGGCAFIAVRKQVLGGPRSVAADVLYLYPCGAAKALVTNGLPAATALGAWSGGPTRWDWQAVEALLKG